MIGQTGGQPGERMSGNRVRTHIRNQTFTVHLTSKSINIGVKKLLLNIYFLIEEGCGGGISLKVNKQGVNIQ